jgi:pimeloyl-ACP methyl ester carboxylesterase
MRYAVVVPGSGSSVDFVTRTFGVPLSMAGYTLYAVPPLPDPAAALAEAVERYAPALVGGVSLGAHLVARWAADPTREVAGLLLALPAWTGPPGVVAAASGHAAARVEALGTSGALAEIAAVAEPWVAAELAAAWPGYGTDLAAALRASADSHGPTPEQLRRIRVPAGIVAFTDDPLHPLAVAREWAALIPRARLRTLPLSAPARDRTVLAATALAALPSAD